MAKKRIALSTIVAWLGPGEGAFFKSLGAHPRPGTIAKEDLDPVSSSVGEDEERSAPGILGQSFGDQSVQTIEAFAHVAGVDGHEHPQCARKTQHAWS